MAPSNNSGPAGPKPAGRKAVWPVNQPWWPSTQPWVSLVLRLGLAVVALWAALPKLTHIRQSQMAVRAYELFPAALADLIGIAVPVIELVIAIALIIGLLTRYAAALFGLMMIVFVVGISQAWARGLNIDCGCFGGGGELPEGVPHQYALEIARDIGLALVAAFVVLWPASPASVDKWLRLDPPPR